MELSHSFPIPGRMQLGNGTYRPWLCIFHIRAQVSTLSLLCLYFEVSGDGDVTVLLSGGPIPCQLCAEDDGEGHSGTQSLQGIESSNVAATEAVSVLNHLSNILV